CSILNKIESKSSVGNQFGCHYNNCFKQTDANKLNVHLVAHTHDDVGWLKTVDQYYYGSNSSIQSAGVQYILDSVVVALDQNPDRRFIYVETAFFWKWWTQQDNHTKQTVVKLVNNGQLEIISGGWSMNDEATTHYSAIIDQMTWGFKRLRDMFGEPCGVPKIGWHIDPFGHSRENALLFAKFNFDGLFFSRIDYEDRDKRSADKTLEMIWQTSDDLSREQSDLFTGDMWLGYGNVTAFCWDLNGCRNVFNLNEPIIDDPECEDYNVDDMVNKFVDYMLSYSKYYATNHMMFPMGEDFMYQSANPWFKNMDKLIKYVNERQNKIKVFYSTPTCYLKSLQETNHTFVTKEDDFFPYASDPHSYWTGYFTSRPALKRYERSANNFLQICKQLDVLSAGNGSNANKITALREWMGVMQHHDAVAGTEKQHVADNYVLKLYKSVEKCQQVVSESLAKLLIKQQSAPKLPQQFCQTLNVSACPLTESDNSLAITVYNPTGHSINHTIRLPVTNKMFQVLDFSGKTVQSAVVPIQEAVRRIPERVSKANDELVFEAKIPSLGFSTYLLKQNSVTSKSKTANVRKITTSFTLKAKSFDVMFDKSGKLSSIKLKNGQFVDFKQQFKYYKSKSGNNTKPELRASGAYIFRPEGSSLAYSDYDFEAKLIQSDSIAEVHQKINAYISQVIRVYPNREFIEFDYVCGPIPVNDNIGKEIVAFFQTNLTTNGVFYTDSNGRQMMKRVLNQRPTWNLTITEPESGNYYPVNSRIAIKDVKQNVQMTVLNDRSQGGSSLKDGSVELMIHRRNLFDDKFGVNEPLNEPGTDGQGLVIRGQLKLVVSDIETAAEQHRDLAQRLYMEPLMVFSKYAFSEEQYFKNYKTSYSALNQELPKNIHLLTLEDWTSDNGTVVLLRLEHFYQTNESKSMSKPVDINLNNLFVPFFISEAVEQTLGANQDISEMKNRLKFKTINKNEFIGTELKPINKFDNKNNDLIINLKPMEIKTFLIKLKNKFS
ncbi:lysosomal alpha-mannosidase-like, partial [Oppia nitens]|uniref:lysosomal alpha-mannosidase-like n=1 Tax=Oppia nitens TaxID=1686743 RepID=UPI0023DB3D1D